MILFGKQICKYKKKKQYTNFFSFFSGGMPQKVLSFFVLWSQGSYIAVPCDASRFFRQHRLYLPLHPRFTLLYVVYVHGTGLQLKTDQKKGKDGLLADVGLTQIGHCNIPIRNLLRRIYLYNNVICY